jgi:hypothetical protein
MQNIMTLHSLSPAIRPLAFESISLRVLLQ